MINEYKQSSYALKMDIVSAVDLMLFVDQFHLNRRVVDSDFAT